MAKKYFCDGCGDEIRSWGERNSFRVTVESNDQTKVGAEFDCCDPCGRRLVENANPKTWVRAAPKAA